MNPYYEADGITIYHADCLTPDHEREDYLLALVGPVDAIVTDPPYGDTSLAWDRTPDPAWIACAAQVTRNLWCFGSMRFWLEQARHFDAEGWKYGQEIVWEKHNGSGFHADRFKRVHEFAMQWYRGDWSSVYRDVPVTMDAIARTVKRRGPTPHTGVIGEKVDYETVDGGPRLQRSVIYCRSANGRAAHPTQKPTGILRPLITYSCPSGGTVLDPFMGSGSTLVAAREIGRRAIGIEVDERYCELAARRFDQGSIFDGLEAA